MKRDLEKIIAVLRRELPNLKRKYRVSSLEIFGSYVRGEQQETSDLDLLVTFDETPSLIKFLELESYLSDLLKVKVDLVMKKALKPRIGRKILSEAKSVQ